MIFRNGLFSALALIVFATHSASSQRAYGKVVTDQDLDRSLNGLEEYYGDVPSSVDCKIDKRLVVKLICNSKYLSDLELLNSRAQVYAIENATKSRIDHTRYQGDIPLECRSKVCIYEYYKKHIDDALGGSHHLLNRRLRHFPNLT